MNAIKIYLNEIVREMTRVWMPAFGIGSVMISAIVYGCVSDIFGILDFFLQIALGDNLDNCRIFCWYFN